MVNIISKCRANIGENSALGYRGACGMKQAIVVHTMKKEKGNLWL